MSIESPDQVEPEGSAFRRRLWRIVFKSDTRAGRLFDLVLLWSIVASVAVAGGVGIVFGIYPAIVASRKDPIQALRHD